MEEWSELAAQMGWWPLHVLYSVPVPYHPVAFLFSLGKVSLADPGTSSSSLTFIILVLDGFL